MSGNFAGYWNEIISYDKDILLIELQTLPVLSACLVDRCRVGVSTDQGLFQKLVGSNRPASKDVS